VGVVALFNATIQAEPLGYCSGFLLNSTVMITAGHSLVGVETVSVCFNQTPVKSIQDKEIIYNDEITIYTGAPVTYPDYNYAFAGNEEFQTSDVGLIILDEPVADVTEFPILPEVGFTETLPAKNDLTVIGYGFEIQNTPKNNGPENSWMGSVSRNSATVQLSNSNFNGSELYLKLSANPAQGKGAITFGDSGGPVIYSADGQDVAVAINAFVSSSNCNGVSYHTRLDNAAVQAWIAGYLTH
jgi:V8-like Glu-specific endopeptidase